MKLKFMRRAEEREKERRKAIEALERGEEEEDSMFVNSKNKFEGKRVDSGKVMGAVKEMNKVPEQPVLKMAAEDKTNSRGGDQSSKPEKKS